MSTLFLTSEVVSVANDIRSKILRKGILRTAYVTTPIERGLEHDDLAWHQQNKRAMLGAGFDFFEYTITGKNLDMLRHDLNSADVVYVEGGSLVHMMNQVRTSGFDTFIRQFLADDKVYIGTSTGSFIMAEETAPGLCLETYLEDNFDSRGIGLVNFLVMPHWGTKEFEQGYMNMPHHAYGMGTPMIILNDRQYVWVAGETMRIVEVRA